MDKQEYVNPKDVTVSTDRYMVTGINKRKRITIEIDERELGTILAGLRLVQGVLDLWTEDLLTNGGTFEKLSESEIDALCERLNFAESDGYYNLETLDAL